MDSKTVLHGTYSVDDRRRPAQPIGKRAPAHRPDTRASLVVVLLLSLGLSAAIWGAFASLFWAVL